MLGNIEEGTYVFVLSRLQGLILFVVHEKGKLASNTLMEHFMNIYFKDFYALFSNRYVYFPVFLTHTKDYMLR